MSCRTEPFACGIRCYLEETSVTVTLRDAPQVWLENCLVWPRSVRSKVFYEHSEWRRNTEFSLQTQSNRRRTGTLKILGAEKHFIQCFCGHSLWLISVVKDPDYLGIPFFKSIILKKFCFRGGEPLSLRTLTEKSWSQSTLFG